MRRNRRWIAALLSAMMAVNAISVPVAAEEEILSDQVEWIAGSNENEAYSDVSDQGGVEADSLFIPDVPEMTDTGEDVLIIGDSNEDEPGNTVLEAGDFVKETGIEIVTDPAVSTEAGSDGETVPEDVLFASGEAEETTDDEVESASDGEDLSDEFFTPLEEPGTEEETEGELFVNVSFRWMTSVSRKLTGASKSVKVTYTKQAGASGYWIRYATRADMSDARTIRLTGASGTSYTIKNLKGGKTYYVQVRPYKNQNGKIWHGVYTSVKGVKTKK